MKTITIISSLDRKLFFQSTDHCQEHGLGNDFIPVTYTLPMQVSPRNSLPNGLIKNLNELISIFYDDMIEIPNPNKNYIPKK